MGDTNMKILVCGNAFCLLEQLKDRSLDSFDKVVRVNNWQHIPGYDNRITTLSFYAWHHIGEFEGRYNIVPYTAAAKELWVPHEFTLERAIAITGRTPDYVFTDARKNVVLEEEKLSIPTTGVLTLLMALDISSDVYAAGFDFYRNARMYYYTTDNPPIAAVHTPAREREWYDEKIQQGKIKQL